LGKHVYSTLTEFNKWNILLLYKNDFTYLTI